MPKIWIRIPYLGSRGDFLLKSCLNKVQRFLSKQVNKFITIYTIYDTKKLSYFVSNKDKLPPLSCSNVVYEVACPGCGKTYIGMTQRCLSVRLKNMLPGFLLVLWANIFLSVNMHNTWLLYKTMQLTLLNDLPLPSDNLSSIEILSLVSTTTKYSTQPNLTTTTFLPFLKHYLFNTTNPSSTLVLRPVKNYNFSRNYSNVVLLVGSFFVT